MSGQIVIKMNIRDVGKTPSIYLLQFFFKSDLQTNERVNKIKQ